ncbi:MAG TPA: precorrin-8X methylmutase [Nitrospirae bacterium]|nr:precorrin-8X methylmutase [Nitrospirota bacterium]
MSATGTDKKDRSHIYKLYESPVAPEEIEARSFEAIDREAKSHSFSDDEWIVVRRMIHTTADFSLIGDVKFSTGAIRSACEALRAGASLYADSNMIKSGLSLMRLKAVFPDYTKDKILCHIADEDVAEECKKAGLPRSLYAIRKARPHLDGAVVAIGNAPVALLELNRMIAEGEVRPAVVIAMPVGFVHVIESKEELMGIDAEYITIQGRRGGSGIAVSVVHSLLAIASNQKSGD